MRVPPDRDPPRWRDLPPPATRGAGEGTTGDARLAELGAVSRSLGSIPGPDELRLAHIRQRVLQQVADHDLAQPGDPRGRVRGAGAAHWGAWAWQGWARMAVIVLASLLVGGVATAVTGRLLQGYRIARGQPPAVSRPPIEPPARRAHARHWRVSVKTPTDLDLLVGPDGAAVEVVGGQASMSGEGIAGTVDVVPGKSWREQEIAPRPSPPVPPPPPQAASPDPVPADSVPAALAPGPPRPAQIRLALVEPARSVRARGPMPAPEAAADHAGAPPPQSVDQTAPPSSPFEPPPVLVPPLPAASLSPPASAPAPRVALSARPGGAQPSAPAAPAARPPTSMGMGAEAALMARALGRLRRDHDPILALADLDAHARDFPRGELRHEAKMARAEALLALQRNGEALAILDGIRLGGAATERRVALARAELRAQDGRRGEAIGDFDRVIAAGGDDELAERALFGRALCRLRGGDLGGARADLRAHSARFPTSARHGEIERVLRRLEN